MKEAKGALKYIVVMKEEEDLLQALKIGSKDSKDNLQKYIKCVLRSDSLS